MNVFIVIPNWNGKKYLAESLESLLHQTPKSTVVVSDNGSTDGSVELLQSEFPDVVLLQSKVNNGFAGGVNRGIEYALEHGAEYIILFNNDAVAEKDWVKRLVDAAEAHPEAGIVTGKFLRWDRQTIDSTGDFYSSWGFPFPRGRDEKDAGQYDEPEWVFGASGGATLYRADLFKKIGLFDEDFFAYFEDTDINFRAQLAGFKAWYEPRAVAYHHVGGTSSKLGTFGRYHTSKNFHYVYLKNMPGRLFWKYLPKAAVASLLMIVHDIKRLQFHRIAGAYLEAARRFPANLKKRRRIQKTRRVSLAYINSILYHPLPPTQKTLLGMRKRLGLSPK